MQVHRRFLRSLRLGGYSGDIVVLCDSVQMAPDVRQFLREQSVETVDVAPHLNDPDFKRLRLTSASSCGTICTRRWRSGSGTATDWCC